MKHGSLFSGIGGFDLAAEWMGWQNIFHCEWNDFGKKVLKHYWPNAISYDDITKSDFTIHRGNIDILTGGFPCQPYSSAGKRKGTEDDRHLWPEMLRAIREIQPRWIVGENVRGLTNWNGGMVFDQVQADLETEGFEVLPFLLPACAVNAPHRRDRIWFVAHNNSGRINMCMERGDNIENTAKRSANDIEQNDLRNSIWFSQKSIPKYERTEWKQFPVQPPLRSRNDGLPSRLDGITVSKWFEQSAKAYGNAVVPQVVFQIFKAIEQYELQMFQ